MTHSQDTHTHTHAHTHTHTIYHKSYGLRLMLSTHDALDVLNTRERAQVQIAMRGLALLKVGGTCVTVWRSVLQRVAACCSVLQRVAVCCNMLQCVAVCCSKQQCGIWRCSTWEVCLVFFCIAETALLLPCTSSHF